MHYFTLSLLTFTSAKEHVMDMSYQEKSIAGSLVAMLVVYGYYFAAVLRNAGQSEFGGTALGRLIFAVIAIIVIEIVYHIALSVTTRPEKDERDVIVALKAYRNAYFAYGTGASLVIAYVIVAGFVHDAAPAKLIFTPFLLVNLVLLFAVLAETVKFVSQLLYYTRGTR
jgi:hypothetical protein